MVVRTRDVVITREPVELYKILKFEAMASSGGEAKAAIAAGQVRLNGEVETRKRKKIVAGDLIEFNGERILVSTGAELERTAEKGADNEDQ